MAMLAPLPPRLRVFAAFAGAFGLWMIWALYGAHVMAALWPDPLSSATTLERLGQVGDLFGGVNALFSAFAFAGVAVAAFFQWRTNQQTLIQTFETTFFSSLDLLHRITETLTFNSKIIPASEEMERILRATEKWPPEEKVFEGREVFREISKRISQAAGGDYQAALGFYRLLQEAHNYVLGHYFRHLYQILRHIDRQPEEVISFDRKNQYSSILRAQLSTSELALLLLNCTGDMVDDGEFRSLLSRYKMLEHLPMSLNERSGFYFAKETGLPLGDSVVLRTFENVNVHAPHRARPSRGAFGTNPSVRL